MPAAGRGDGVKKPGYWSMDGLNMAAAVGKNVCPHCGSRLQKWRVPSGATWNAEFFLVCFSDQCPYYRNGWTWMKAQFNQHASYRYVLNPTTGVGSMIPVWSDDATRELIVEASDG